MASQADRTAAAVRRKALHLAIAQRDVHAMRQAIHDLYVDEESPLRKAGEVKRIETYAPMVEATILTHVFARDTPLCKEMALNFEHTHNTFGVSHADYQVVVGQLARIGEEDGLDAHDVDWCAGTALHNMVKPWRHESLFGPGRGNAS